MIKKLFRSKIIHVVIILLFSVWAGYFVYERPFLVQQPKVGVLYLATGKYIQFFDSFYESAEKYFLPGVKKTYFLFTDDMEKKLPPNVVRIYQKQLVWPGPAVYRYHFFDKMRLAFKPYDYLFFFNANMLILKPIGYEVLPTRSQKIMVAHHPAFYYEKGINPKIFTYDRNPLSNAYISYEEGGDGYYMGAFNGGRTEDFLTMARVIKERVDDETARGVVALWHDESHLNRYYMDIQKQGVQPLVLLPKYSIPEESLYNVGIYSNLNHLKHDVKMIIRDKSNWGGHDFLRKMSEDDD